MSSFKMYDIRGLYPEEVNEELVAKIGAQFSKINKDLVIGYDIRKGSESLARAFIQAALKCGCNVVDVGLVPNPVCFYQAFKNKCHGVYVTASHNPAGYNGIKIVNSEGCTDMSALKFLEKNLESEPEIGAGSLVKNFHAELDYLNKLLDVKINRKVRVGVDCLNGSSGLIIKNVLANHNIEGTVINGIPKQDFGGKKPEPSVENAKELVKIVVDEGLDFGIIFDGDCDRSLVVSDTGEIISGDVMGVILSKELYSGKPVVTPVNTSMIVNDLNQKIVWTPIGRPFIEKVLADKRLEFGFEMSNHFYFNDFYPFSDGFLALLKIAKFVEGRKLSNYLKKLPETFMVRENFDFESVVERDNVFDGLEVLFKKLYDRVNTLDGVKVSLSDGWFLLRKSNTEPIIRFSAESKDEHVVKRFLEDFKKRF
ncbi:MAG: hypothetical protein GON13_02335 [Nanoarchaeota archaeon]|nr:hypothetical protein [Nanoarchaeota archaeon]